MRQTGGEYAKSWMVAHPVPLLNTPRLSQPSFTSSELALTEVFHKQGFNKRHARRGF